jgi:hypothetical protein
VVRPRQQRRVEKFAVAPAATPVSLLRSAAVYALFVVPSVNVSADWVPV